MPSHKKPAIMHLFRGAPAVRSWSKHQQTVEEWTLCGIRRGTAKFVRRDAAPATEEAALVSCRYCRMLMRPVASIRPRTEAQGA